MKKIITTLLPLTIISCSHSSVDDSTPPEEDQTTTDDALLDGSSQGSLAPVNVLFLFSDQHNAKIMGCAGNPIVLTPTMDALAQSGVYFANAYCQVGVSVASRASLMSGVYARESGVLSNSDSPSDQGRWTMLAQLFQYNGFSTGCFGKRHLGNDLMATGWDRSATTISTTQDKDTDHNYYDWLVEQGQYELYNSVDATENSLNIAISLIDNQYRDAAYTADRTIEYIKECAKEGNRFFIWSSFVGPHQPYAPTQSWADLYPIGSIPLPSSHKQPADSLPKQLYNWRTRTTPPPWNFAAADDTQYQTFLSYYYAQVSEVDHYMGEIINTLKEAGVYENTVIIYSSDHGEFAARNGMVEKCNSGHNVYDATLRVPLIISHPGSLRQGVTSDEVVGLIDIYPTLVDIMGLKKPVLGMQNLAGESLANHLSAGKELDRKYIFSENWSQVSVISKDHTLGVWIDPYNAYSGKSDMRGEFPDMLFDHATDPEEVSNKIYDESYDSVEQTLRSELENWLTSTSTQGRDELIAPYYTSVDE